MSRVPGTSVLQGQRGCQVDRVTNIVMLQQSIIRVLLPAAFDALEPDERGEVCNALSLLAALVPEAHAPEMPN